MKIKSEFFDEEWLYNLIIEQNALRYPIGLNVSIRLIERGRVDNWELLCEGLKHISIVNLECTHDVFATEDQVHYACHNHPLCELLWFEA